MRIYADFIEWLKNTLSAIRRIEIRYLGVLFPHLTTSDNQILKCKRGAKKDTVAKGWANSMTLVANRVSHRSDFELISNRFRD
jgi:hypothetical protein